MHSHLRLIMRIAKMDAQSILESNSNRNRVINLRTIKVQKFEDFCQKSQEIICKQAISVSGKYRNSIIHTQFFYYSTAFGPHSRRT